MIELSTSEILDVFNVGSSGTLSKWKDLGAREAYKGRNQWDLKAFLDWFLQNIYRSFDTETLQAERLRYEKARADKMEIQVATLRGDLKPKKEIHQQWADRMAVVISGLTMYEGRLPPLLEGKTQGEMRTIIRKENHRLRDHYCKAGGR